MHWLSVFHLVLGVGCIIGSYQNFAAERFTNVELALGIILGLVGFLVILLALFPIPPYIGGEY